MQAFVIEIERPDGRRTRAVIRERSAGGLVETDDPREATFFARGSDAADAAAYVREGPKFPRDATACVRAVEVGRVTEFWHVAVDGVQWPHAHIRLDARGLKAGRAAGATKFARLESAEHAGGLLKTAGVRNVDVSVSKTPVLVREDAPPE